MNHSKTLNFRALTHHFGRKASSDAAGLGELGGGAGKGGGGGGTVREAGGALGKRGAAKEEEYFYKKQKEQLSVLKKELEKENCEHNNEIKRLKDAIEDNRKRIEEVDKCYGKNKE